MKFDIKFRLSIKTLHLLCISLFVLYAMSRSSWGFLIPNSIWSIFIVLSCFATAICFAKGNSAELFKQPQVCLFICMMCIILFNRNYDISHKGLITGYFEFIYLSFLYISCSSLGKWMKGIIQLIVFLGFIYAIGTIICFMYPSLYYNKIYPLFNYNSWFTPHPSAGFTADYSTNGNYISIGLIALLSCIFFHGLHKSPKRKLSKIILIIFVIALVCNGKRAAIAGIIFGLFICYWNYTSDQKRKRGLKIFGIIVLGVLLVYVSITLIPQVSAVFDRFAAIGNGDATTNVRLSLWKYAIKKIMENPIFGFGWRWFKYNNPVMYEYDVHNTILQLLVENGIVFSLPFFIFMIVTYIRTLSLSKLVRKKKNLIPDSEIPYIYFSLMAQTYLLFLMQFGTTFYLRECTTIYYLCCAIQVFYSSKIKKIKRENFK